ncbi:cytochrome P450 [soil metagenome]
MTVADRTPDLVRGFSKTVTEDPDILHGRLRRECPVALQADAVTGQTAWLLTRYEDIVEAASNPELFGQGIRWPGQRRPPLESDPPEHRPFRALMQPFFMPASLAALEPVSRGIATRLLEPLLEAGGGDFAHDFARPLPPQVLLARMGQPLTDWLEIKDACEAAYLQDATDPADLARYHASNDFLWDYSRDAVADRKTTPRDPKADMIAAMLVGRIDDVPVDEDLIVGAVRLILAAGHDSTTSALGICLRYLAENGEAQSGLRAEPAGIPAAIEEILRLQSPVIQMMRTVRADTTLGGRDLSTGDRVQLVFASGNRDEAAFDDAQNAALDRKPNRHLAFGVGPHVCIGNGLARQEIKVALEELLARTLRFSLSAEPVREFWHPYGAVSLPLRLEL